jgi:hypothetical protein
VKKVSHKPREGTLSKERTTPLRTRRHKRDTAGRA